MRRDTLALALALATLGAAAPALAAAKPPPPAYVQLRLGGYFPVHSEVSSYEAGLDGEVAVGYAPDPGFAFEGALGAFRIQQRGTPGRQLRVIPLTFAVRGTTTLGRFQPYVLAGAGAFFVHDELLGQVDQTTNLGAFAGIGGNVDVGDRIFVGVEGRYVYLSTSTFATGTRLDGITLTGGAGLRF